MSQPFVFNQSLTHSMFTDGIKTIPIKRDIVLLVVAKTSDQRLWVQNWVCFVRIGYVYTLCICRAVEVNG